MGEEKYYKNDCLKIIMDIYKVIGSIGKFLVVIQNGEGIDREWEWVSLQELPIPAFLFSYR